MNNIFRNILNKISNNYDLKVILRVSLMALVAIVLIEMIGNFYRSANTKYFIENKSNEKFSIIFNQSIISGFYNQLSSAPFNYLTPLEKNKSANSYRVFLIGEAALSGWPYSAEHALQNKLNRLLGHYLKNENIEIMTISSAGFNTSQAVDIIPQLIELKPDLIILYAGHNEFYGYHGYSTISAQSKSYLFGFTQNLLNKIGLVNSIDYDKSVDDLDVLLPFNSDEQIITTSQSEYKKIRSQFQSNVDKIISICNKSKIQLAFTLLSDNYLLPPIGVINRNIDVSADIIYNNARMALKRDGNPSKAIQLFKKSKDADAFRLRIPEDFIQYLKEASIINNLSIADVNTEFIKNCPNGIPGDDLFLDYIHPNANGLNIIASVYAKLILENFIDKTNSMTEPNSIICNDLISKEDSLLVKERIGKSLTLLKKFDNTQYLNAATMK